MPELAPPRDVVLPDVEESTSGAAAVLAARLPTVPLVQVRARLSTGGGPASALLAACLLDGTVDGRTLRQRLETLGATSDVRSDADGVVLSVAAKAESAAEVIALMCAVPSAEPARSAVLSAERTRLAAITETLLSDAGQSARRHALALAYGADHLYAEPLPTAADLAGVDAPRLAEQLRSAAMTSLVVVGDVDPRVALDAVTDQPDQPDLPSPTRSLAPAAGSGAVFVDRRGSVQTALRTVVAAPALGDPGRAAVEVLDRILGNGSCSVLSRILRERHGYGYHPASDLVTHRSAAQLELVIDVAIEVTSAALGVLEEELAALIDGRVAPEWLEIGRRGALAGLGRRLDGQASLADLLQELAAAGLTLAYLPQHVKALHAVTADDIQALAGDVLDVDRMAAVLVSDRTGVSGQPRSRLLDSAL